MTKTYSSKISYGLVIVIFLVFFGPLITNLIYNGLNKKMILLIVFLIIVFGFILHMFLKTEYIIDDHQLKIKSGFFTYKPIEIKDIKEITKSNNISSSPAASFDRIEIKYGKFEEMIISPKDKFEFAKYLTNLNPKIRNNITEE
jgi:hypothetical protein